MDIITLYNDYSVSYQTEGHKHTRPGWVNTECPVCNGNPGLHLGWNIQGNYFVCWRCGFASTIPTIAKLLNIPEQEARKIIKQYGLLIPKLTKEPQVRIRVKAHRLPTNAEPLQTSHRKYLTNRGFDPDLLERTWNLLGTGPVSLLDKINYKHRIIIPFIWNGQQVSFDSRDITNKSRSKYMACPKDRELISHKEILYGKQEKWKEKIILVEGPTDVWKIGSSSCAVSGIKYTHQQVRLLSKFFRRIAVMFDDDPQAKVQANKIVAELKFRGVDAFRVEIEGDPGSMKQEDANYLVKQLMK